MQFMDIIDWFKDNWRIFALLGIFSIPTIIHFSIINQGYVSPHWIRAMALNTPFKAIVGTIAGVMIGSAINKKTGE